MKRLLSLTIVLGSMLAAGGCGGDDKPTFNKSEPPKDNPTAPPGYKNPGAVPKAK